MQEATLEQLPLTYPKLLMIVRVIWKHSKFYNTKERLTSFLRKVSNVIIARCKLQVNLNEIFNGDCYFSIEQLKASINAGETWKKSYFQQTLQITTFSTNKIKWDLDENGIFAQIDAFIQRCQDLLEVCQGQIQFARKLENNKKQPLPVFGGTNNSELAAGLEDIENAFKRQVEKLWMAKDLILDVKASQWHDLFNSFKHSFKDLEIMLVQLCNSAFSRAVTIADRCHYLTIFHQLAKRPSIQQMVAKNVEKLGMNSVKN